jgi:hypothetical protein
MDRETAIRIAEECGAFVEVDTVGSLDFYERFAVAVEANCVPKWQPIDTAPKDGTKILAYTNDGYKFPLVSQCVWDDGWWPDVWESPENPIEPTHWMPLPSAPAPKEES